MLNRENNILIKFSTIKTLVVVAGSLFLFSDIIQANDLDAKLIERAVSQLDEAEKISHLSRDLIIEANSIRKQLMTIRANALKNAQSVNVQSSNAQNEVTIKTLVAQLEESQKRGASLRNRSETLKKDAADNFEKGFVGRWSNWVTNRQPLTMDTEVENYLAHNTRIRSVHKNMPQTTQSASVETAQRDDMSLLVPALVNQNAPPDLDINAFKFSRKEQYFAHIEVHSAGGAKVASGNVGNMTPNSSNVSAVPLNQIHQWRLLVSDRSGNPVPGLNFLLEGHMPGHVHGLPTEPRVTKEIAPGVYLVDGMKFQMKGWWVVKFILQSGKENNENDTQADFFTFNLVL